MGFKRFVVPFVLLVIFAAGGVVVYQAADYAMDDADRVEKTVENETLVQETAAYQYVNKSLETFTAGFNDSVRVWNASDVELTDGTDYDWNETDGTIRFYDTARTNDGSTANITYDYLENTQDVKTLWGPVSGIVAAVGETPLFVAGLGLVVLLIVVAGFFAKKMTGGGPRTNR